MTDNQLLTTVIIALLGVIAVQNLRTGAGTNAINQNTAGQTWLYQKAEQGVVTAAKVAELVISNAELVASNKTLLESNTAYQLEIKALKEEIKSLKEQVATLIAQKAIADDKVIVAEDRADAAAAATPDVPAPAVPVQGGAA